MEVSSSSIIYKSVLAISFIVLLSYFPAEGRVPVHFTTGEKSPDTNMNTIGENSPDTNTNPIGDNSPYTNPIGENSPDMNTNPIGENSRDTNTHPIGENSPDPITRGSFPRDFYFGVGSSALQIEGSNNEGGRGLSVWDSIILNDMKVNNPATVMDAVKFPTMIEHYKRHKEDIIFLRKLGINTYRFSIQWSRILPDGTLEGGVNQEGIDFYNNLINEVLANGITPFVTILHFDYPLNLLLTFGGFLNRDIVNRYKDYCQVLFENFGDRVKHWGTINEPEISAVYNYMHGFDNPSPDEQCQTTRECRDAYTVMHNFILSHATAVKLYREQFQAIQGGEIGLIISIENYTPYSSNPEDVAAAQRLTDFFAGWTLEALFNGDYPESMKQLVGDRLPVFTEEEKALVKGSTDFIGINYYHAFYARNEPNKALIKNLDNYDSLAVKELQNAEGKGLGYVDVPNERFVYPEGLYHALVYLRDKYQNPKIYITENGIGSGNLKNPLQDTHRVRFIAEHIKQTKLAIDAGVNVRGYFAWAAFDSFEFRQGFSTKWGLIYVDFNHHLMRVPKESAKWYRHFLIGAAKI